MGAPKGNCNACKGGRKGGTHRKMIKDFSKISRSKHGRWKLGAIHHIANTSSLSSHKIIARYLRMKYKVK